MTTSRKLTALVLALVLTAALAACSQPATPEGTAPSAETSVPTSVEPTIESTPESPTAQDASGAWAIVEQKCTVCHTIERVTQAEKDWTGWNSAVDHMVDNGAKMSAEERKAVVDYLAERK